MPFRNATLLILLCLGAIAAMTLALFWGSGSSSGGEVLAVLFGSGDPTVRDIVLRVRLPRALAAFGTGACLAQAGVLMQVLLRNPLADPYILGTSGGAAVAALTAMLVGATGMVVDGAAFGGALASTVLVFGLARARGEWAPGRLLLTGVVVAAGWGAVISLLLATSPEAGLRGMLFWLMGDFAFAGEPWAVLMVATIGAAAGVAGGQALNLLATGEQQAALLGLPVRQARVCVYLAAAGLTALAVTTAGTVGFVGLVVPHLLRLAGATDHRSLVPGAALAGGILLVMADTAARTALAPQQLPVGAITALVGVPLFLLLLRQAPGRGRVA
jgi:iron complex transport system permease protein